MKSVLKSTEEGTFLYLQLTEREVRSLYKDIAPAFPSAAPMYSLFESHLLDFLNKISKPTKLERLHHNQTPDGFEALR